jgi:hypothetical protein
MEIFYLEIATIAQVTIASVTLINLVMNLSNSYKITKVEHNTNYLTKELVNEVRIASIAKGILEGRSGG